MKILVAESLSMMAGWMAREGLHRADVLEA